MPRRKRWTVMVYLAGDNNLDSFGLADLREMKQVGSTDDVNVIAQFDRAGTSLATRRYYLRRGGRTPDDAVENLGETNMGDPSVLEHFLAWGVARYPAEHYLAVLWNHGAGWDDTNIYRVARRDLGLSLTRRGTEAEPAEHPRGSISSGHLRAVSRRRFQRALFRSTVRKAAATRAIAFDDDAEDFLDNVELKRVLSRFHRLTGEKLDILGLDACLMSMVEVGYQVRRDVGYTVGSQEIEPGEGWPYGDILKDLARRPSLTPAALASLIVKRYLASYGRGAGVTQSALDLSAAESLKQAVDRLGRALSGGLSERPVRTAILLARAQVQQYDDPPQQYVDLGDLCRLIRSNVRHAGIAAACRAVETCLEPGEFVVASGFRGRIVAQSSGVSIYFPPARLSPLYRRLDFAKRTSWNEFLTRYLRLIRRR
jgi:hypothetical protein